MYEYIPEELKSLNQWVLWKKLPRNGRVAKVPFSVNGAYARTNDSRTWASFNEAVAVSSEYDGIGFVFTENDPYVGIDIDHCVEMDGYKPILTEEAEYLIDLFHSYAEISQSETGIHIIIKAKKASKVCKPDGIEIYERGRYFCMTGNELFMSWEIGERQEELDEILPVRVNER